MDASHEPTGSGSASRRWNTSLQAPEGRAPALTACKYPDKAIGVVLSKRTNFGIINEINAASQGGASYWPVYAEAVAHANAKLATNHGATIRASEPVERIRLAEAVIRRVPQTGGIRFAIPPYKLRHGHVRHASGLGPPSSVSQISLPLTQPIPLIRRSQRLQVLRRRSRIVHPFSQQRPAVDDIDRELAVLVLVGEIAP